MDDWAWEQLHQWLTVRVELPVGPLFCAPTGPTPGRAWTQAAALEQPAPHRGARRRPAMTMQRDGTPASSPDRASRADDQDQEQLSRLEDVFDHLGEVAPMSIEGSPGHTG